MNIPGLFRFAKRRANEVTLVPWRARLEVAGCLGATRGYPCQRELSDRLELLPFNVQSHATPMLLLTVPSKSIGSSGSCDIAPITMRRGVAPDHPAISCHNGEYP